VHPHPHKRTHSNTYTHRHTTHTPEKGESEKRLTVNFFKKKIKKEVYTHITSKSERHIGQNVRLRLKFRFRFRFRSQGTKLGEAK
jgi:hypothetical protein